MLDVTITRPANNGDDLTDEVWCTVSEAFISSPFNMDERLMRSPPTVFSSVC